MTKERKFKKKYAAELLRIALGDLEAAEILAKGKTSRKENILFHVGQAVEKALKSVLCHAGKPVPLTHDLNVIVDRIPVEFALPHAEELEDLSQFATIRRYEEGAAVFTDQEIKTSIRVASKILEWATQRCS